MHNPFNDAPGDVRYRIIGIYCILAVLNVGAWLWAIAAFHHYSVLLGTAFLAYSLGLRHPVDADHIAAIDNVTRKLMQDGKQPVAPDCDKATSGLMNWQTRMLGSMRPAPKRVSSSLPKRHSLIYETDCTPSVLIVD